MAQSTKDYSIFKSIKGNRKVNKNHALILVNAIERKNLLPHFPILLNEKMEVIDGQHRLTAAVKLGYAVHYDIIPGLRLEDVMSINTNSKGWTLMDFIDSYIELGKPDYAVLKDFVSRHKMGISVAAALLRGYTYLRSGGATKLIKKGEFHVGSYDQAEKIANEVTQLTSFCNFEASRDREFISALVKLSRNKSFDFKRLISKLEVNELTIERRHSEKYYIIEIEELYNFNVKSDLSRTELYASTLSI